MRAAAELASRRRLTRGPRHARTAACTLGVVKFRPLKRVRGLRAASPAGIATPWADRQASNLDPACFNSRAVTGTRTGDRAGPSGDVALDELADVAVRAAGDAPVEEALGARAGLALAGAPPQAVSVEPASNRRSAADASDAAGDARLAGFQRRPASRSSPNHRRIAARYLCFLDLATALRGP